MMKIACVAFCGLTKCSLSGAGDRIQLLLLDNFCFALVHLHVGIMRRLKIILNLRNQLSHTLSFFSHFFPNCMKTAHLSWICLFKANLDLLLPTCSHVWIHMSMLKNASFPIQLHICVNVRESADVLAILSLFSNRFVDDVLPQPILNWFIYHTDFILRHSYYLLFNCLNYSSSFKRHGMYNQFSIHRSLTFRPCLHSTLHKTLEVAWRLPQIIRNIWFSKCG